VYVEVEDEVALARAVVSPEVATRLGEEPVGSAVVVEGPIGGESSRDLREALNAMSAEAS
jgi:hypothetical protein